MTGRCWEVAPSGPTVRQALDLAGTAIAGKALRVTAVVWCITAVPSGVC